MEQLQLFYTAEEVAEATAKAVLEANADTDIRITRATDNLNMRCGEAVMTTLRIAVNNGDIMADTGVDIYNSIAEQLEWKTIESLRNKYTVAVNYKGYTVAEFADVEADSAEEAGAMVLMDADIEATVEVTVSYNGESGSYAVDIDSWDLDDADFDTEVVEQEE